MKSDLPNIRFARPSVERAVAIVWKGGVESIVDLAEHLHAYAVFEPLRDEALFRTLSVGEFGWSLHWSDDMEISSDTLWRLGLEQGAAWLRSWRLGRGMTQSDAAAALGIGSRMWRYYEAGEHLLPKTVRLACHGLDAQARAA